MARIAVAVVGMIVLWGFASLREGESLVGTYVREIRLAPYRERTIRLAIAEDGGFSFGWRTVYDGTEEDRGEVHGAWQEVEGAVQLTAAWEGSPFAAMRTFGLPGDRRVVLAGSGIPPIPPGGTSWTVWSLRRAPR